jgi:hypothetical protein
MIHRAHRRTIVVIDHGHRIDTLATYDLPRWLVPSTKPLHDCGEEGRKLLMKNQWCMLFGSRHYK